MSTDREMSRYSLLACVEAEARAMVRLGMPITDGLRDALERVHWRDWAHEGDGPSVEKAAP